MFPLSLMQREPAECRSTFHGRDHVGFDLFSFSLVKMRVRRVGRSACDCTSVLHRSSFLLLLLLRQFLLPTTACRHTLFGNDSDPLYSPLYPGNTSDTLFGCIARRPHSPIRWVCFRSSPSPLPREIHFFQVRFFLATPSELETGRCTTF